MREIKRRVHPTGQIRDNKRIGSGRIVEFRREDAKEAKRNDRKTQPTVTSILKKSCINTLLNGSSPFDGTIECLRR